MVKHTIIVKDNNNRVCELWPVEQVCIKILKIHSSEILLKCFFHYYFHFDKTKYGIVVSVATIQVCYLLICLAVGFSQILLNISFTWVQNPKEKFLVQNRTVNRLKFVPSKCLSKMYVQIRFSSAQLENVKDALIFHESNSIPPHALNLLWVKTIIYLKFHNIKKILTSNHQMFHLQRKILL